MAGEPDQAEKIAVDLEKRFPEDTLVNFFSMPVARPRRPSIARMGEGD